MRDFIKKSLTDALLKGAKGINEFNYQYNRADGDTISLKGVITKKNKQYLSDFRIERTKADGHKCSAVPVFGMPLKQKTISQIAEFAAEQL